MRARKTQRIVVCQNSKRVGTLEKSTSGAISFLYDPKWLANNGTFPISLNLPLREESFKGTAVSVFFDNLLPDNIDMRNKIAAKVKAESSKTFDLLRAIGHDCVGALQFLDANASIPKHEKVRGSALSERKIATQLKNLSFLPLGMTEEDPEFRISIAGAQEKTALLKWMGKWYRPQGATPSTHILKPPMGMLHNGIDLTTSVENEWLCLQICHLLGLKVPKCEIVTFDTEKCLVIERFDRKWITPEKLIRLPQEDFCQALGFPSNMKYEADGGPGIKHIMSLLDSSDERNCDRADFMRSQVIFFLLAATDGHAKNYSIFHSSTGFQLTPFYDVMSIFPATKKKQIAFQKGKLSMAIGNSRYYRLKQICRRHFEETAKQVGFPAHTINEILNELKEKVSAKTFSDQIKLPKKFPEEIFNSIMEGLKKQAMRI